ncbi:MAG: D-aminoacyl-tRNA deacylase [Myxococcota bacterium]
MRVLLQRVSEASVRVEGQLVGEIGQGLLLFLGVGPGDTAAEGKWLAEKTAGLRIFEDDDGRMNRSVTDVGGSALVVSQFTLYGDCRKGRRPSFVGAAPPSLAEPLYDTFCEQLKDAGVTHVARGRFGADMKVALVNQGPVTLWLEREATD